MKKNKIGPKVLSEQLGTPRRSLRMHHFLNKNNIQTGKIVVENNAHALYMSGKRSCLNFCSRIGRLSKHPYKK